MLSGHKFFQILVFFIFVRRLRDDTFYFFLPFGSDPFAFEDGLLSKLIFLKFQLIFHLEDEKIFMFVFLSELFNFTKKFTLLDPLSFSLDLNIFGQGGVEVVSFPFGLFKFVLKKLDGPVLFIDELFLSLHVLSINIDLVLCGIMFGL